MAGHSPSVPCLLLKLYFCWCHATLMLKLNIPIRMCLYVCLFFVKASLSHRNAAVTLTSSKWCAQEYSVRYPRFTCSFLCFVVADSNCCRHVEGISSATIQVRSFPRNSRSVLENTNEEVFSLWYMMTMSLWQNVAGNQVLTVMDHQSIKSKSLLVCLSWNELKLRVAARKVWL